MGYHRPFVKARFLSAHSKTTPSYYYIVRRIPIIKLIKRNFLQKITNLKIFRKRVNREEFKNSKNLDFSMYKGKMPNLKFHHMQYTLYISQKMIIRKLLKNKVKSKKRSAMQITCNSFSEPYNGPWSYPYFITK